MKIARLYNTPPSPYQLEFTIVSYFKSLIGLCSMLSILTYLLMLSVWLQVHAGLRLI